MEDWQCKVIKTKKDKLISLTRCNQLLLAILEANGILSSEEKDEIDSKAVQMHKAAKLYDIIQARKGAYDILVNASKETNQSGLTEILQDAERVNNFSTASRECWKIERVYSVKNPFFFIPKLNFECLRQAIAHYVELQIFKVVFDVKEAMKPWLLRGPINETLLHISVAYGYTTLLEYLISLGVDLNSTDILGRTPLHYVGKFSTNILETTEIFNKNHINLRQVDGNGLTIASTAVHYGKINQYHYHHWVDFMVKTGYGDMFAQKSKDGSTSLHHALEMLDLDNGTIESILKSSNLSINESCDRGGHTVFHFALISGRSLKTIKTLIELGGDYKIKDKNKEGALHLSVRGSNREVISFLISLKLDINEVNKLDQTPLHKVVLTKSRDFLGMTTFLLDLKADLQAKDKDEGNLAHLFAVTENISSDDFQVWVKGIIDIGHGNIFAERGFVGRTPLQYAIRRLDLDLTTIKLILKSSKVNIDQPDDNGSTLLHLALYFGRSIQTIKNLIQLGANITLKNNNESGALHFAVISGNKEAIQYLVSLDLDVNEKNKYGDTPLHLVPQTRLKNFFEMTTFLLNLKADLQAKNKYGNNIAHLFAITENISPDDFQVWVKGMIDDGHGHIFAVRGQYGRTPLQSAMETLDLDFNTMKLILESSKVNINKPTDNGCTLLHLALDFGRSIQTIKNLIQLGANIKLKDNNGKGTLHFAVFGGNKEAIQYLVTLYLDVNEKDKHGNTALHKVPHTRLKNYFEMTKFLLEKGANLRATDANAKTLDYLMSSKVSADEYCLWKEEMIKLGHATFFEWDK